MNVRDKSRTGYKGRIGWALDELCPCRPCFNMHDCGYTNSQGKWVLHMHCATSWNKGCPDDIDRIPAHIYTSPRSRVCLRCGQHKFAKKGSI